MLITCILNSNDSYFSEGVGAHDCEFGSGFSIIHDVKVDEFLELK